jgi:acetoacetyl-[acyl-carrier protein] synthase
MGIPWDEILKVIRPDQVSVYAGSSLGQLDQWGFGGLYQNPLTGGRASSKMMALSMAQMTADFINGYMIRSVGATGAAVGACATFLYNLRQGVIDIQSGRAKVVIVGNTEAPLVPAIMEGFQVMGALCTDADLKKLDQSETPNYRRACRPFSTNAGFVMAEASQFVILMDDTLALNLGASIYGSVPDVFVNADAGKKSISAPGIGNTLTVAKATAMLEHLLGRGGLAKTFVQAHGTGTPQNRVTESAILNQVAAHFGIASWPVTAVKSYVGHSLGPAAGDQIMSALGVWAEGVLPGIPTIDHVADDVEQSHLQILQKHVSLDQTDAMQGCLINSKGFGGNNSSAPLLSPMSTRGLLERRHGHAEMHHYWRRHESVAQNQRDYDAKAVHTGVPIIYDFGQSVIAPEDLKLNGDQCELPHFAHSIDLRNYTQYSDLLSDHDETHG